jgi:hypothetical protein
VARVVKRTYEWGTFVSQETSASDQWPAGDPVPRDKETLVVYLERIYHGTTQETAHTEVS